MIKSITVTNHLNESLTMTLKSPEQSGFIIRNIDGLGPAPAMINTLDILSLDGTVVNSARLGPRNLVLDIEFYDTVTQTAEDLRQKTYKYFPIKRPVTLLIETDNRIGMTVGYVESNSPVPFSSRESTQISILCPSALFYDTTFVETLFSGSVGGFEFPFEDPTASSPSLEFGELYFSTRGNVFYGGDIATGLEIRMSFLGPVTNLYIYNVTTGQGMSISSTKIATLTGSNFIAGDELILSTVKGNKSIQLTRAGVTYNVLNALGTSVDWIELESGDNVFTFTADSGITNLQMSTIHQIVYEGI